MAYRLHLLQLTDQTRVQHAACLDECRGIAACRPIGMLDPRLLHHLQHRQRLAGGAPQRLFADEITAEPGGERDNVSVRTCRCGSNHDIRTQILNRRAPVQTDVDAPQFSSHRIRGPSRTPAQGDNIHASTSQGTGVTLARPAGTHNHGTKPHCRHHPFRTHLRHLTFRPLHAYAGATTAWRFTTQIVGLCSESKPKGELTLWTSALTRVRTQSELRRSAASGPSTSNRSRGTRPRRPQRSRTLPSPCSRGSGCCRPTTAELPRT